MKSKTLQFFKLTNIKLRKKLIDFSTKLRRMTLQNNPFKKNKSSKMKHYQLKIFIHHQYMMIRIKRLLGQ